MRKPQGLGSNRGIMSATRRGAEKEMCVEEQEEDGGGGECWGCIAPEGRTDLPSPLPGLLLQGIQPDPWEGQGRTP